MNETYLKIACSGVVAGTLIACAGAASTLAAAGSLLIKALIFPFGLLLICYGGFQLFTGNIYKIGRDNTLSIDDKVGLLTVNYIANWLGAFLVSLLVKIPMESTFLDKVSYGAGKLFFLGVACNILVCLGVKLFKTSPIATFIAVALFIACGFEHSIADMYYFACLPFTFPYLWGSFAVLAIVTLGNIVGGWLVIKIERIMEHDS